MPQFKSISFVTSKFLPWGLPGGLVVKTAFPLQETGATGLIPGLGTKTPHAVA